MASTPQIHPEGKIDIHQRQAQFDRRLSVLTSDETTDVESKELIERFLRDCALGRTVLGKAKKRIGVARRLKYLTILRLLASWFGKPFSQVQQQDMERLIERLDSDEIVQQNCKPYSDATKADIKKTIKKFWKWKDGQNQFYPDLVAWIESYDPVKEIPALSRQEVERMIDQTASLRDKALLMVLFDSGARVEELLNVRLKPEHLFFKETVQCYMIRLEFSKTKPRTISLPLSTRYIQEWLSIHPARDNPQAQFFPLNYGNLRMLIGRIGRRVLGKRVTPHMLRHSSATFYANKLRNRYKLCYRYGWAMSSDMVDRYLDREGIFEEETVETVVKDEITVAQKQKSQMAEELSMVREAYSDISQKYERLSEKLALVESKGGFLSMLQGLARQQEEMAQVLRSLKGKGFDLVLPVEQAKAEQGHC